MATDVLALLTAEETRDDERDALVLAALEGAHALDRYLDDGAPPAKPEPQPETTTGAPAREPLGAYLKSITVEGFRGIGPQRKLDLPPGPGLTLVVGRNGSGKSSFAEALELLLTGDTFRWSQRTKVWREGWRNLHHAPTAIEAEFYVEGDKPTRVARAWPDSAALPDAVTTAQPLGKKKGSLDDLGWPPPLKTYRPILSYNELGALLDEGPSKLFDALSAILGLDDLTQALETLAEARKSRDKAHKEAGETRTALLERLKALDDDRARTLVPAMEKKDWGIAAVEAVLAKAATGADQESDLQVLRQLASLHGPTQEAAAKVVSDLRDADAGLQRTAGTLAAKSKDLAAILDQALRFHERHGDGDCPVCGRKAALDKDWHAHQAKETARLRDLAQDATQAQTQADAAKRAAAALPSPPPDTLAKATTVGLDATAATQAAAQWQAKPADPNDLAALARHIEDTAAPLEHALAALRANASAELQRREDRWKPLALDLAAWLPQAQKAQKGAAALKNIRTAETWLKEAAAAIRNERFAPIKDKAQHVWTQLRLQSNVSLDDVRLAGSATRRQVELDVSIDGTKGPAALGVMSQGELNALALSLFIPRATLKESPFRFVVIDDPVQSMDPSRVDGLARVLQDTARTRQVVVFTHDDRLPEAVRRLAIPAHVIEVTRREHSVVELRPGKDPIARYIEDAMALAYTDGLPPEAARRVIPGLCREALEAACMEAVRRRRLARGQPHADVESVLLDAQKLTNLAALALFDDPARAADVMTRINKEAGRSSGDTFKACNDGAHGKFDGVLVDFIRDSEKLAGWLRSQA